MKTYKVAVIQTITTEVYVDIEAESQQEAEDMAGQNYMNDEYNAEFTEKELKCAYGVEWTVEAII